MNHEGSYFTRVADWVSSFIGTPLNIGFWLVLTVSWTLAFAFNPALAQHPFLPEWFNSLAYNLPLNLITTVAELFIGFLCAAATSRAEKHLREMLAMMHHMLQRIEALVEKEEAELLEDRKMLIRIDKKLDALLSTQEQGIDW